jgi:ankyrin repeat protein
MALEQQNSHKEFADKLYQRVLTDPLFRPIRRFYSGANLLHNKETILHYFLLGDDHEDHYDLIKELLNFGFNIDPTIGDYNPLRAAIESNRLDFVKLLFEHGAHVKNLDWNPLATAAETGNMEMVIFLIEQGLDIKPDGNLMHNTVFGGSMQMLEYFMSQGHELIYDESWDSLEAATYADNVEMFEYIEKDYPKEIDYEYILEKVYKINSINIFRYLVFSDKLNMDKIKDKYLYGCALSGHHDILKLFLENGADATANNSYILQECIRPRYHRCSCCYGSNEEFTKKQNHMLISAKILVQYGATINDPKKLKVLDLDLD